MIKQTCGQIVGTYLVGKTLDSYVGKKIVLMIRNPLDRLESEFGFLSNRDTF